MRKIKSFCKSLTIVFTCLIVVLTSIGLLLADTISDGQGNTMMITSDADYMYITYEGAYSSYLQSSVNISIPGANLNAYSQIIINQSNSMDNTSLRIYNSWYQTIEGATGTIVNDNNEMTYTIAVPWSTYAGFNPTEVTINWPMANESVTIPYQAVTDTPDGPVTPDTPDNPTEPSSPTINPGDLVTGGIVIDGEFDDWSKYPVSIIGHNNNNSEANHRASMVVQGDNLYVHVKMSDLYTNQMPMQTWYITINDGATITADILTIKNNGQVQWGLPQGNGIHSNLGVFLQYNTSNSYGDASYVIYDSAHKRAGDEIEFSVDLDALSRLTGIPREDMRTISVTNPNIGSQSLTIAGTSTGTYLGVAICVLATLSSCYIALKMDKNRTKEDKE